MMTEPRMRALLCVAAAALLAAGCDPDPDPEPELAEGIYAPLGEVLPSATLDQKATFERGRAVALKRFSPEEGLGPDFNITFCAGCHERPVFGGSGPRYRNFQLVGANLEDGSHIPLGKNGVQTHYNIDGSHVPTSEGVNAISTRNAIPFFGVGLLAEINEEAILAHADEDDADGDGISGRPNWDRGFVGRFGRKSQTVSIEGFIRGPLFNHLGITTNPLPNELKAQLPVPSVAEVRTRGSFATLEQPQAAAPDDPVVDNDGVPDPELSEQDLFDLIAFSMLLAAPEPEVPTEASKAGLRTFIEIGCESCHVQSLEGPRGLIPAYSDLLLHDMGPELADGVTMGVATGSEFRTAPLWGIAAVAPYLHDGRADTLDEAIRWHGGEGQAARDAYVALSSEDKANLMAFLDSLGGADEHTSGLLPVDAPLPSEGFGAPAVDLSAEEQERFLAGREVFDRDVFVSDGLGPNFNGDSCRACHFEPDIGGAGPLGVNVTRQGVLEASTGDYSDPPGGSMLHRFSINWYERVRFEPMVTHFEFRQTPPLFGLGLIEQIPDETITAAADPDDTDGDGISGRAHVLSDGRLGRFGWKADVPSVEEFMRDALSNEVGMSLPERDGQTFGMLTDGDEVLDPEMDPADYDNLLFWIATLAPPPRGAPETAGETLFGDTGCAACHTPTLQTAAGEDVHLYSDLLLHDVAAPDAVGIEAGMATMREFRTPPLWGVSASGPWMHDGAASTLDAAIRAHHAEGQAAREAYEALPEDDQRALLDFLRSL